MSGKMFSRKDFLKGAFGLAALPAAECTRDFAPSAPLRRSEERQNELVAKWDEATKAVAPKDYFAYFRDGDTREFKALKALELAFDKVLREARETVVSGDVPAVWSVYNMGHIVKTRDSIFSIDLKHRRANEFVPLLDFALVTHAHKDHYNPGFARAMEKAGKPLASGFLKNSALAEIKAKAEAEGHADAFKIATWRYGLSASIMRRRSGGSTSPRRSRWLSAAGGFSTRATAESRTANFA